MGDERKSYITAKRVFSTCRGREDGEIKKIGKERRGRKGKQDE